jgi:hypothetical protein
MIPIVVPYFQGRAGVLHEALASIAAQQLTDMLCM